jgi:hypothetical protein
MPIHSNTAPSVLGISGSETWSIFSLMGRWNFPGPGGAAAASASAAAQGSLLAGNGMHKGGALRLETCGVSQPVSPGRAQRPSSLFGEHWHLYRSRFRLIQPLSGPGRVGSTQLGCCGAPRFRVLGLPSQSAGVPAARHFQRHAPCAPSPSGRPWGATGSLRLSACLPVARYSQSSCPCALHDVQCPLLPRLQWQARLHYRHWHLLLVYYSLECSNSRT